MQPEKRPLFLDSARRRRQALKLALAVRGPPAIVAALFFAIGYFVGRT